MSRRKEIFKDAGIYALSSYGSQFMDMVNGVLVRRFLGPTSMGIWSFLQVILSYTKHSGLGVTAATTRDVPYYLGKGEKEKAEETKNLVFSFTLITALLTAAVMILFAWGKRHTYSTVIFHGLIVVSVLLVLQRLYNLFVALLRAHKEFVFAAVLNFMMSAAGILFTVALTRTFKLYGCFAGILLNFVIGILFILVRTGYRFSFVLAWKKVWPLVQFGFAMLLFDILRSILVSVDRLMITKFLGFEALGHYSIALMAQNYVASLPTMLAVILSPHLQEAYARRDNVRDIEIFLMEPTISLNYLLPILIGAIWIFADEFVGLLLPQYRVGIPALKFLLLSTFFYAHTHNFTAFLITLKKHWWLIPITLVSIAVGFFASWFSIRLGWGIGGVAIANIFLWAFNFVALSIPSLKKVLSGGKIWKLYGQLAGTFFYFFSALLAYDSLIRRNVQGLGGIGVGLLYFLVFISPLVYFAEKQSKVFSTLIAMVLGKERKRGKGIPEGTIFPEDLAREEGLGQ